MKGKNILLTAFIIAMTLPLLLAGCGGASTEDIDRGYTDPGWWETAPTIYYTDAASITYGGSPYSAGSSDKDKKSVIFGYVINSVYYIAIAYCDDVTSNTSFAFKLYFTVDFIPSILGDLGTIDLMDGTHNPVVKIRPDASSTYVGGTITAGSTPTLAFSRGSDLVPSSGDQARVNISLSGSFTVPNGGDVTAMSFTDLIRVPY